MLKNLWEENFMVFTGTACICASAIIYITDGGDIGKAVGYTVAVILSWWAICQTIKTIVDNLD